MALVSTQLACGDERLDAVEQCLERARFDRNCRLVVEPCYEPEVEDVDRKGVRPAVEYTGRSDESVRRVLEVLRNILERLLPDLRPVEENGRHVVGVHLDGKGRIREGRREREGSPIQDGGGPRPEEARLTADPLATGNGRRVRRVRREDERVLECHSPVL